MVEDQWVRLLFQRLSHHLNGHDTAPVIGQCLRGSTVSQRVCHERGQGAGSAALPCRIGAEAGFLRRRLQAMSSTRMLFSSLHCFASRLAQG